MTTLYRAPTVVLLAGLLIAAQALAGDAYHRPTRAQTFDERLLDIARELPSFGGMYFDSKSATLVVYARQDATRAEQELVKVAVLGEFPAIAYEVDRIALLPARYSVLELSDWRHRIDEGLATDSIVYTDMDEARNRVEIAVSSGSALGELEIAAWLARVGVPREAVAVTQSEPVEKLLQHRHRPVDGGIQVAGWALGCTLGFTNWHNEELALGYVTNAHCTPTFGGVDEGIHYQPNVGPVFNQIGVERRDRTPFTNIDDPNCPANWVSCRYSDAAWFEIIDVIPTPTRGFIARVPLGFDPQHDEWNGEKKWRIASVLADSAVGMAVGKVGRTTGYTRGTIVNTCVNVSPGPGSPGLLCQTKMQGIDSPFVSPGDSGSPAFRDMSANRPYQPYDAQLLGIIALRSEPNIGYYSPLPGIMADLGSMVPCPDVCWDP